MRHDARTTYPCIVVVADDLYNREVDRGHVHAHTLLGATSIWTRQERLEVIMGGHRIEVQKDRAVQEFYESQGARQGIVFRIAFIFKVMTQPRRSMPRVRYHRHMRLI